MSIRSLKDLRPGDYMISGQNTAPNKLLVYIGQIIMGDHVRFGKFAAGHVATVVPGDMLVEAMPSGARVRDILPTDWSPAHVYFRMQEDYPYQAEDAAAVALAMVGTPYSLMSYVYLAAFRFGFKPKWLAKRINRRHTTHIQLPSGRCTTDFLPVEAICSVMGEQAWTLTGKKVIHGTKPQVVTPGMLCQQLWDRPGVIKGGAGING